MKPQNEKQKEYRREYYKKRYKEDPVFKARMKEIQKKYYLNHKKKVIKKVREWQDNHKKEQS